MNKLIIEDDEGKTTIVPLIRDEITIGRKEGNTIRLTERNVSRRHAKLLKNNGAVLLEDLGSYNGIKVNGSRVKDPVEVNEGDRIQIGDYILALKVDSQRAVAADPFEEMKTIPMEKEEVEANIAEQELASQARDTLNEKIPSSGTSPQPAQPQGAEAPSPATEESLPGAATQQPQQKADLVDEEAKSQAQQPAGRIVMVSAPSRGKEFTLESEATIIGRWPENDLVVDHQSISRHHAKILREDNHYTIVDMGSQNGVLVNGEKYDRVELRKGDMIDLGHVRFRYVAPNEDYDISLDLLGKEKSSKGLYIGIGILGAVGLLIAAFVFWPKEEKEKSDAKEGVAVQDKQEGDEKVGDDDPSDGDEPRVSSLDRSKINAAIDAKDWEKAITEAQAFLKLHEDDDKAKELLQKAKNEKENEKQFNRFMKNWKRGQFLAAAKLGKGFPQDSIYYKEIKTLYPQALEKYTAPLLKKAIALQRRKKCAELQALSRDVTDLNPSETRFQPLVENCGKETAVARGGQRKTTRDKTSREPSRAREPRTDRPKTRDSSSDDAEQLVKEARDSWARNDCSRALRAARKAYRVKPSTLLVYIIGSCACKTKRPKTAKWAYERLSGGRKRLVAKACSENGISLP